MCRIPKSVLLTKAKQMQREYLIVCMRSGVEPEHVDVTMKWIGRWLIENRLTDKRPNRKYKVARWIVKERLCIFLLKVHKIRKWIILQFGYDPDFRNVDQSPFHRDEAGSVAHNTLVEQNAASVPLL